MSTLTASITTSAHLGYIIMAPGRGPSDVEVNRMIALHQHGIAAFFYALTNDNLVPTIRTPTIIVKA